MRHCDESFMIEINEKLNVVFKALTNALNITVVSDNLDLCIICRFQGPVVYYTTFTNFSTKCLMMWKVYTNVGGIK